MAKMLAAAWWGHAENAVTSGRSPHSTAQAWCYAGWRAGEESLMINIEIVDECEAKVEIDEKFYIARNELDEFKKKLAALIEEYRI